LTFSNLVYTYSTIMNAMQIGKRWYPTVRYTSKQITTVGYEHPTVRDQ
jgi:hypothetical protein